MSSPEREENAGERIIRLERRIAWLEETLASLDSAVTRQEREIRSLSRQLSTLRESFENPQARNLTDRPPHW